LSGLLEINHQFLNHYPGTNLNILYAMVYTPVFVFIYYTLSPKIQVVNFSSGGVKLTILLICLIVYLLLTPQYYSLQHLMLEGGKKPINQSLYGTLDRRCIYRPAVLQGDPPVPANTWTKA
jgi:hypothetical protein